MHCSNWYLYFLKRFADDPVYASKEEQLRLNGRHKKPPRPPTPPRMWDISFPDTDSDIMDLIYTIQFKAWEA